MYRLAQTIKSKTGNPYKTTQCQKKIVVHYDFSRSIFVSVGIVLKSMPESHLSLNLTSWVQKGLHQKPIEV